MPALPEESDATLEVWRDGEGHVAAFGYSALHRRWVRLPGVGAFAFDPEIDEVVAVADPGVTRARVLDAYRRAVLPIFQQARRHQVLHASAVRASAGVVAFCGTSGTGKSTVAYGFARRGYPVWGDDAVCFETSDGGIDTIPMPFDLLLRPATASFFDVSADTARITRMDSEVGASHSVPVAAVCILKRRVDVGLRPPVEVEPLRSADAFTATLEHAYTLGLTETNRRKRLVEEYLQLAAATPVFDVIFDSGLDRLETLVDAIEQRLGLEPPTE